ncbi:hypothetical protein D4764_0192040 [Takifugu flavidus]|uniref:Zinc finger BED domain-containing protein 1 n=1 Tax=Takifugu flavidus TaxID=433684 RepID=A0A5C6MLE3_9TELE|nr:hypothetical protein D4764_0192040 [Takifugu flavidus]
MRHYRAKHENEAGAAVMTFPPGDRKQELDEALVDFIVKDSQPFTVVSDPGFRALVAKLDPTCTLPSRQTVKAMVERRDVEEKEKAKAALQNVDSVSLTADMWTSINMDAYLAVTCHAIHAGELSTTLVGVRPFPISHTAENVAGTARELLREWALEEKHAVCLAHALNLIVKKAMDATPGLDNIRSKTRRMITYFKSSTTAKEKLQQIQNAPTQEDPPSTSTAQPEPAASSQGPSGVLDDKQSPIPKPVPPGKPVPRNTSILCALREGVF